MYSDPFEWSGSNTVNDLFTVVLFWIISEGYSASFECNGVKTPNYANTRLVYKLDIFDQPQLIVDVGVWQYLKYLWAKLDELQGLFQLDKFTKFYEFQAY